MIASEINAPEQYGFIVTARLKFLARFDVPCGV
jgi:hypothetical protein